MRVAVSTVLAVAVCLSSATLASSQAVDTNTTNTNTTSINTTTPTRPTAGIQSIDWICTSPIGAIPYYFLTKNNGLVDCDFSGTRAAEFAMLNAYRSGGQQNLHWKYTNNPNDPDCLRNWKYYNSMGTDLIENVSGRITMKGDTKWWCGMPVYRTGGIKGKQWEDCQCSWNDNGR